MINNDISAPEGVIPKQEPSSKDIVESYITFTQFMTQSITGIVTGPVRIGIIDPSTLIKGHLMIIYYMKYMNICWHEYFLPKEEDKSGYVKGVFDKLQSNTNTKGVVCIIFKIKAIAEKVIESLSKVEIPSNLGKDNVEELRSWLTFWVSNFIKTNFTVEDFVSFFVSSGCTGKSVDVKSNTTCDNSNVYKKGEDLFLFK